MKKTTIVGIIAFILLNFILLKGIQPEKFDLQAGHISPVDIYATRDVVDKLATEKQRLEAESQIQPQYVIDNEITIRADRDLADIFIDIDSLKEISASEEQINLDSFSADKNAIKYLVFMNANDYTRLRTSLTEIQKNLLNKGVTNKAEAITSAQRRLKELMFNDETIKSAIAILESTIAVNKEINEEATNQEKERIRSSISSVTYKENQIIVRKGEIVTLEQIGVLSDLGLIKGTSSVDFSKALGVFVTVLMCFVLSYLYLKKYNQEIIKNNSLFILLCIIFVFNLAQIFTVRFENIDIYAIPIITGSILIAILFDIRLAIVLNTITALFTGFIFKGNAYYFLSIIIAGNLGAFVFTRAGARRTLVIASLLQCLVNAILFASTGLLEGIEIYNSLMRGLYGLVSGAITSVLVIGTLPFWEYAFDVTTPFKLLELSNPDQPLLKRLLLEAPGTYHHSLMVGNLAEAACEEIGGNPLLARVGSYYHDIGKLKQPMLFKENQYGENPHDKMAPVLSASVLISHVADGAEMANKYRLPGAVKNIIKVHHGTTRVEYFYQKAKKLEENVIEEKFRYKHEKPKTREEAVIMLADSVEAAVRAMDDKSPEAVLKVVTKIVWGKQSDGQLNSSDLTLQDISTLINVFVKVFSGYFHSRIKYPTDKREDKIK